MAEKYPLVKMAFRFVYYAEDHDFPPEFTFDEPFVYTITELRVITDRIKTDELETGYAGIQEQIDRQLKRKEE